MAFALVGLGCLGIGALAVAAGDRPRVVYAALKHATADHPWRLILLTREAREASGDKVIVYDNGSNAVVNAHEVSSSGQPFGRWRVTPHNAKNRRVLRHFARELRQQGFTMIRTGAGASGAPLAVQHCRITRFDRRARCRFGTP